MPNEPAPALLKMCLLIASQRQKQTLIGDGIQQAAFRAGQGGDSVQLTADVGLNLTDNLKLTGQLQYQRRVRREGIDDWGINGGMEFTF
ncbi:MAG: hypothetical protein ABN478_09290 [Mixta sp.]